MRYVLQKKKKNFKHFFNHASLWAAETDFRAATNADMRIGTRLISVWQVASCQISRDHPSKIGTTWPHDRPK